jgi:DNA modification methylase
VQVLNQESSDNWTAYHGDCCEVTKGLPDNSIDLSVYSPPFFSLYVYSDSMCDMGNCNDMAEFMEHYGILLRELYRVTVPGRISAVHCKDLPMYLNRDGAAGLVDFPGKIIAAHEAAGWTYHSRVTIWKCPVTERERTNNHGLLHKTVCKDSSAIRQGMADYMLMFRKSGETLMSDKPIARPNGFTRYVGDPADDPRTTDSHPSPYARKAHAKLQSIDIWRRYAEPVWWDIDVTDVLNFKLGRDSGDERHICPLQKGVIRRCVELWSNPGDVVFTPFMGVGSEAVVAVEEGRKAIGIELKESYYKLACKYLLAADAVASTKSRSLFSEESEDANAA